MSTLVKKNGVYVIKPGDDLTKIAASQGRSLADLLAQNPQFRAPTHSGATDLIKPGQTVNYSSLVGGSKTGSTAPVSSGPSYAPLAPPQITNPQFPSGNPNGTGGFPVTPATGAGGSSVTDLLTTILKNSQKKANDQYTGNNTALMAGEEAIGRTNAGVYSGDLANANLTNEARLALLGNDGSLQEGGLKSIVNQQRMNESHYETSNKLISDTLEQYNKEQDRIERAKSDLADAEYKAQVLQETIRSNKADEANSRNGSGGNTKSLTAQFTDDFEAITGEDNYVDPNEWIAARTLWGQKGLSDSSFVSNFKRYLNPLSYKMAGFTAPAGGITEKQQALIDALKK